MNSDHFAKHNLAQHNGKLSILRIHHRNLSKYYNIYAWLAYYMIKLRFAIVLMNKIIWENKIIIFFKVLMFCCYNHIFRE